MKLIYFCLTIGLILINVAAITMYFSRWLPTYALARASGLLILGLLCFFVEHFVGLGQLKGFWLLSTIAATIVLYRHKEQLLSPCYWRAELVFVAALLYALAWKWIFPVIYPTSERVTDLYFIGNYLTGYSLPPPDHWFPPHRFDFYYGFQHYIAALMGRVIGLSPGLTYNFAFALLMSIPITLAWNFIAIFLQQSWKRWLVILTFVLGGTGATVFVGLGYHQLNNHQHINHVNTVMWSSARFIGKTDQQLNTQIGQHLFPKPDASEPKPQELPLENFGYQFYVGDYHPPIGGFLLLALALTLIAVLETCETNDKAIIQDSKYPIDQSHKNAILQALLALTIPAMIATNTWTFPLQTALILGWIIWRYTCKKPPDWFSLIAGGIAGFLLLYPFLASFTHNAAPTPVKLVSTAEHTPLRQFMAMHWPLLLFTAITIFQKQHRRLGLCFALVFLGLLFVSEMIYIDDPSGDQYQRTNTVMKWWGWIWTGGLITLATLLLSSHQRWHQVITVSALLIINLYAIDIARYWIYTGKYNVGKLSADSLYTRDTTTRNMFNYLAQAPYGVVLENCYGNAYTDSGIYSAFAAKPTVLGWPSHLVTWYGKMKHVWNLKQEINQFYSGTLASPGNWLLSHQVQYIVWNAKDNAQANVWRAIDNTISNHYRWQTFQSKGTSSIGLWVRKS